MNTRTKRSQFKKQKKSIYKQAYSNKYKLVPNYLDGKVEEFNQYKQQVRDDHHKYKFELLKERGNKCAMCDETDFLTLHHTEYVMGKTGLKWVVVLCHNCHQKVHAKSI